MSEFFKKMMLDSEKMFMSDHAKYALLQAKDDLLSGKVSDALEIISHLLVVVKSNSEKES